MLRSASKPSLNMAVRKLQRIHPLSETEQQAILEALQQQVDFGPNADIVCDGDKPKFGNVILEGMAYRYKTFSHGTRQIGTFHIAGDFCDSQSLLMDAMDHSIATVGPCRLAVYRHDVMHRVLDNYPNIMRAFWKEALCEASIQRERIISLGRRSAYERLAHLFCETMIRMQAVGLTRGRSYHFPFTQAQLGDAMGLSSVHTNRTLQELRADELISFTGSTVSIHDWERLRRIAAFDPEYLQLKISGPAAN